MQARHAMFATALFALSSCAALTPPTPVQVAAMPQVAYPEPPPAGDYVYKLPAGRPIEMHIVADGNLLAANVEQTLTARLAHDLYLHKDWASEDGQHWVPAGKLVDVKLTLRLPSYRTPGPGELHMTLDQKVAK
jgi:hypothetical protein